MRRILFAISLLLLPGLAAAEETENKLAAFAPYVGKTFVGEMTGAPEPTKDVQKWEQILGGAALRITHSLNDGAYGGETLIYQDKKTGVLAYVYVTTAGFRTEGSFEVEEDGSWTAEEAVVGHETIVAVRSSGYIDDEGRLISNSTYINKDGSETPGHGFVYVESPDAEPVFK